MILLRFLQKLLKTLNSDGTPSQVAVGMALGAAFGLTPLVNAHNLVILAIIMVFNISFPAAMLGWMMFAPLGFLLDPMFNTIGETLLVQTSGLNPAWTTMYNTPFIPLSNYNNTVVLGSLVGWVLLSVPIYLLCRWLVTKYREEVLERLRRTKLFKVIGASKIYNIYRWFQPE